jgi:transposase
LVTDLLAALAEQTVVVPGSAAAEKVLPRLADSLAQVLAQRRQIAEEVEGILDTHPPAKVLTSRPGVGVRTAARILLEVGVGSTFPTAGHLPAYAGLAPVTRRSGSSIRGEHPPQGGSKQLKRALFPSAFAALADPTSRAYYDRNRTAGKRHNAALIRLARRRVDVLCRHAPRRHRLPPPPTGLTEPIGTPPVAPVAGATGDRSAARPPGRELGQLVVIDRQPSNVFREDTSTSMANTHT